MRLLLPTDVPYATDPLDDEGLAEVYRHPRDVEAEDADGTWLRANFVSTLDGAANGPDGRSGSINTHADKEVFALLRALADVIVVGAGTARVEGYRAPIVAGRWKPVRERHGLAPQPQMVVVSASGDVPPLLAEQRDQAGDVLLLTHESAPPEAVDLARRSLGDDKVLLCGAEEVDFLAARQELAGRGMRRALCEGGPHLMRSLTAQDAVDELCLTITPSLIAGEHTRILAGEPVRADFTPHSLIEADGSLICRWVRADAP